ncbi:MAG: hypothetical protein ACWA44_13540 [Thiotrichales bacterium]
MIDKQTDTNLKSTVLDFANSQNTALGQAGALLNSLMCNDHFKELNEDHLADIITTTEALVEKSRRQSNELWETVKEIELEHAGQSPDAGTFMDASGT